MTKTTKYPSWVVQICPNKSNTVDGAIIKYRKKLLYLCKRLTDFDEIWRGYADQPSGAPQLIKLQNFWNPRWWQPPRWEIKKSWYLKNCLTNFDKIWHNYACRPSGLHLPVQIENFKNPRWQLQPATILRNRKSRNNPEIDWHILTKFGVVMHLGLWATSANKIWEFLKSKMASAAILKIKKITITLQ